MVFSGGLVRSINIMAVKGGEVCFCNTSIELV